MTAYTFADAKSEFNLTCDGDAWGSAMAWWFSIADEIEFNRDFPVPAEWQFRASPLGPSNEPDRYETEIVQNMPDSDLQRFGALIHRYARFLKHCGKSY